MPSYIVQFIATHYWWRPKEEIVWKIIDTFMADTPTVVFKHNDLYAYGPEPINCWKSI